MRKILALLASVCIVSVLLLVGCESVSQTPSAKPEIKGLPEDFSVYVSSEVTIPDVQYTEGANLSVTVNDPSGAAVPIAEGKFIPTAVGNYVITYRVTLKEEEVEETVIVTVIDTDVPPTIALEGDNIERVLLGEQVTLVSATAKDAFGKELAVTIRVTSPTDGDVPLTDGAFTAAEKGEYKVVYSVTDAFGNPATIENTILCYNQPQAVVPVPEGVKNSFETEEECSLERLNAESGNASFVCNSTEEDVHAVKSGAYSLKVTTTGGGTFNLVSEAICGAKDFSGMGTLSFWAYNGNGAAVGMSIYNVVLTNGASKNVNIYKLLPVPVAGSESEAWTRYEINLIDCGFTAEQLENVYSLSLWVGGAGTYYIDDISWDSRVDYVTLADVQERVEAEVGEEVTLESPAVSSNAQLIVTVTDPDGETVTVADGKFTVEKAGWYTIAYTAKGTDRELTKNTTVIVTDPSEDVIPDNVYSFETFEGAANTLNTFATAADRACTSIEMSSGKANAHSGTRSIHFTVNTQVVVGWLPAQIFGTQKFGPNVGSISFWVRSVNGGKFTLWGVNTVTPSGTVYGTNQFELPAGVWTEITVDLTEAKYDDYRKADGGIEIYWIKFTAAVGEYYLDDFTINARQDYVTIEEVEAEIEQEIGEVTIPVPGVSQGATLTVTVSDPAGNQLEYSSDYKFTPACSGNYTVTFTATNEFGAFVSKTTVFRIVPRIDGAEALIEREFGEIAIPVPVVSEGATLTVTVSDPAGNPVDYSSDYKFTPERGGDFTVTYCATEGNISAVKKTVLRVAPKAVCPVPESVYNSFETAAQRAVKTTSVWTDNSTNDNVAGVRSGAWSKKLTVGQENIDSFTLTALFFNEANDFTEIGTISFWLYNAGTEEVTFSITQIALTGGKKFTVSESISVPVGKWRQFSLNMRTFDMTDVQLTRVGSFKCAVSAPADLYLDDISWSSPEDCVSIGAADLPAEIVLGEKVTLLCPEVSEGAQLNVSVLDPDGVSLSVTEGDSFTPEKVGVYEIKYTAVKGSFSVERIVTVTVTEPA